ncbi:MAG: PCMD domain-containing protein [Bacteroidales bacterium]|nr:PCMD domain-containing protein [Bacteroidales bacterium]
MRKYLFFTIVLIFISGFAFSQKAIFSVENGGFENWEIPAGLDSTLMEPVNWSSLKTSDNPSLSNVAPVVWRLSPDAHSGNYSVYLTNISIFGVVATGTITNGRVHADMNPDNGYVFTDTTDTRWNSRIDSRPDSLVGWYKYNSTGNDKGVVDVDLHVGYYQKPGSDDDSTRLVGKAMFKTPPETVTEWTRFAVPFEYFDDRKPEYYLFILNSGDGKAAVAGSEIWLDDISFVYNDVPALKKSIRQEIFFVYASFGNIHIRMDSNITAGYQVVVTDILGRKIFRKKIAAGEEVTLNPGQKGIFIVRGSNGKETFSRKVMVR